VLALLKAKHRATFVVALYLLRRDWEVHHAPIKVTSIATAQLGVDRKRKREALDELGAGTDPSTAAGQAVTHHHPSMRTWAILAHVLKPNMG
jgi:hypothetical protein